jgi:UDP-N-acetylglucosamine:LPS N-acetylglucosamine transferase
MFKVSLLYAKSGGGHISLARATEEALNKYYPGKFNCVYFDPFPEIYSSSYRRFGSDFQTIWGTLWHATNNSPASTFVLHYPNQQFISQKLLKHLREFQPDIVISNNPLLTTEIKPALQKINSPAKTVIYFADPFTIHQTWLAEKDADLYLSPTPEATRIAIQNLIPPGRIKTVGWLTRQKFLSGPLPPLPIRKTLGLNPEKFTIFIGGAGQGGGKIRKFCQRLMQNSLIVEKGQLIVNTGLNPSLASEIIKLAEKKPGFFNIIPYANNIPELLSASDIVIGKAGPNFMFEAVHMLRPILATGCLPGQEEGNLEYIKSSGIGWVEEDQNTAISLISSLITNPSLLKSKLKYLKEVKKQHLRAPRDVAWEIAQLARVRRLIF